MQTSSPSPTPEPHRLGIYTDGSGINGKIGAAAVCDQNILRAHIGRADLYTVCYGELYGILMATSLTNLIINIEKQYNITTATIYTDNQAAIRKVQNPNNKSGQCLVQNIVIMIDGLRATGVKIDLRWVPAHVGIPGNEKADIEAKKATGLRKMRKRNNKVVEVDTKYTALPAHGTKPLQKCIRTTLAKSALAEWKQEWEIETKGRHLRLLVNAPTRDILEIHKGLDKQLSSLVVQMRTGKIGLRKFLYERRVPGVEDKGCDLCGQGEQTVHHILSTCRKFRAERESTWKEEEKGYAWRNITTKSMLTSPQYARKAAIFMKNTGLLGLFKARDREEENRT